MPHRQLGRRCGAFEHFQEKGLVGGRFDFIDGYTIYPSTGKVVFPVVEPFGSHLAMKIGNEALARTPPAITTTEPRGTFMALSLICEPAEAWYSPESMNLFLSAYWRATTRVESY